MVYWTEEFKTKFEDGEKRAFDKMQEAIRN